MMGRRTRAHDTTAASSPAVSERPTRREAATSRARASIAARATQETNTTVTRSLAATALGALMVLIAACGEAAESPRRLEHLRDGR